MSGSFSLTHRNFVSVKFGNAGLQVSWISLSAANFLRKVAALFFRADVAPDKCRTHDQIRFVQHHGTVHLTGESYAGNVFAAQACRSEHLAHGDAAGAPPVFGPLFRPADLRRSKRFMLLRGGPNHTSFLIDE